MKISTAELRKFKNSASAIKPNLTIPILSYIKFDNGTITKNSLDSFIIHKVDFKGSFLVDERILNNFISYTQKPEIEITVKDNKIILSDGSAKVVSPTDDIANFPTNDTPTSEPVQLSVETLDSIRIAANFIDDEELQSVKCFVFVGLDHVCGSNGTIAYINKLTESVPQMVLSKQTAASVGKYSALLFSENDSYVFFESGETKLGFIKPAFNFFDMTPFGKYEKGIQFVISKPEFISLNDMATNSTQSKVPMATIEVNNNELNFEMNDLGYEVNIQKKIEVKGDDAGQFSFNPALMNRLLKSLPDNQLTFYHAQNKYIVTGESGFTSLIMKLAL